jgi:hypothetical protein
MLLQGLFISSDVHAIEFTPERNGVKIRVIDKSHAETGDELRLTPCKPLG